MFNITQIISKFIKNSSQRELDRLNPLVKKINELEPKVKEVSSENFKIKTSEAAPYDDYEHVIVS